MESARQLRLNKEHVDEVWKTVSERHGNLLTRQLQKFREQQQINVTNSQSREILLRSDDFWSCGGDEDTFYTTMSITRQVSELSTKSLANSTLESFSVRAGTVNTAQQQRQSGEKSSTRKTKTTCEKYCCCTGGGSTNEKEFSTQGSNTSHKTDQKTQTPNMDDPDLREDFLRRLLETAKGGYVDHFCSEAQITIAFVCAMIGKPEWEAFIKLLLSVKPDNDESPTIDSQIVKPVIDINDRVRTPLLRMTSVNTTISRQQSSLKMRTNAFLHEVAKAGRCKMLESYLNEANVNVQNNLEETALHFSARCGNSEDVRILLAKGADIMYDSKGCTPLHAAAMAFKPDSDVAELLTADRYKMYIDHECQDRSNTALHFAAGNANVTQEFISQFKHAKSKMTNLDGDTPFHVAAESTNPEAIIYMLNTFGGWDIDEVDAGRKQQTKELLIDICATAGNSEAVALLIQRGADISQGVLHKIVTESVRDPGKVTKLVEVYRAIVHNAVAWAELENNVMETATGSDEYNRRLRETMMALITTPVPGYPDDVLKHAIKCGASEMFQEILDTEHVFRENKNQRNRCYDVTNFLIATRPKPKTETERDSREQNTQNSPYVRTLLRYYDEWLDKDALRKQPIKKLFDPYITFIKGVYLVLALLQLLFMIFFGMVYMPTTCSLSEMFRLNITESHNCHVPNTMRNSPSKLWLVWPSVLLGGSIINLLWAVYVIYDNKEHAKSDKGRISIKVKSTRNILSEWFGTISFYLWQAVPFVAFYISVFCWYAEYTNSRRHDQYLSVTSMVFLFGWLTTLLFVTGVTKDFFVFSLLLKEIVLKDIVTSFLAVFAFAVVGFSFALHTLRLSVLPTDRLVTFQATFFDAFGAAFGIGDLMETARQEFTNAGMPFTLFESVFISYVCFATIILLNVLIAMLNNRFKISKRRAENLFRFHILRTAVELERFRWFRNRFALENDPQKHSKMHAFIRGLRVNDPVEESGKRYWLPVKFTVERSKD